MIPVLDILPEELGELIALAPVASDTSWERDGFLAVFSHRDASVWATPGAGRTPWDRRPPSLSGRSILLDWLRALVQVEQPAGGRFFVRGDGVYVHRTTRKERVLELRLIAPPPSPLSEFVSPPPEMLTLTTDEGTDDPCQRCGSHEVRNGVCSGCYR